METRGGPAPLVFRLSRQSLPAYPHRRKTFVYHNTSRPQTTAAALQAGLSGGWLSSPLRVTVQALLIRRGALRRSVLTIVFTIAITFDGVIR